MVTRVAVLYLGQLVEVADTTALFEQPRHPYTHALISATPSLDRRQRIVVSGEPPSPLAPPPGCRFHPCCPWAQARCRIEQPALLRDASRLVRCHFPLN
jgi:oligopeptide/dipeptide ABC transporter ATP-binding protein